MAERPSAICTERLVIFSSSQGEPHDRAVENESNGLVPRLPHQAEPDVIEPATALAAVKNDTRRLRRGLRPSLTASARAIHR
ncbi:MAG: hypothetical protein JO249_02240 [Acidobacteria bacterium]|nr:hypothetical protein [Acidobacteriota bacterium]MBV9479558.1 hypothetical protein [Acidobacteriota bacterium]